MSKRLLSAALSGSFLICAMGTTPVFACGNGMEEYRDHRIDSLHSAEYAVRSGKLEQAAKSVIEAMGDIRQKKFLRAGIERRAGRVAALVMVRSAGSWIQEGKLVLGSSKERGVNLAWAIRQLRARAVASPKTEHYQVDLGEALASVKAHRTEGRYLLEDLNKRNLIHSAWALAALARLRSDQGDKKGADQALKECMLRTRDRKICSLKSEKSDAEKS